MTRRTFTAGDRWCLEVEDDGSWTLHDEYTADVAAGSRVAQTKGNGNNDLADLYGLLSHLFDVKPEPVR